jgi:hypothetical protein
MDQRKHDSIVNQTVALLTRYSFEVRGCTAQELIDKWLALYHPHWVRLAVVEALYQGRYKAISVEQILKLWLRRGNPTFHFNHEFERLICHNLPRSFSEAYQSSEDSLDQLEEELSEYFQDSEVVGAKYSSNNLSIDEFIPLLDSSELYTKLQAVLHHNEKRQI